LELVARQRQSDGATATVVVDGGGRQLVSHGDGRAVDPGPRQRFRDHVSRSLLATYGDEDLVRLAAPGHRDVDAGGAGRSVEEQERAVDGAALAGVAGLGVGQLDVLGDVLRGQPHLATAAGDGDAAVPVDGVDGPAVAVLDHELAAGPEPAVVVAG